MIPAEFAAQHPELWRSLSWHVHGAMFVIDVSREDGRWVALVQHGPSAGWETERLLEARCRPGCVDHSERPRDWTWEGHECCAACCAEAEDGVLRGVRGDEDPDPIPHRFEACHE